LSPVSPELQAFLRRNIRVDIDAPLETPSSVIQGQRNLSARSLLELRLPVLEEGLELRVQVRVLAPLLARDVAELGELAQVVELGNSGANELEATWREVEHISVQRNGRAG